MHDGASWRQGPATGTSGMIAPHAVGDCASRVHVVWGETDEPTPEPSAFVQRVRHAAFDSDAEEWSPTSSVTDAGRMNWGRAFVAAPTIDATGTLHLAMTGNIRPLGGSVVVYARKAPGAEWQTHPLSSHVGSYAALTVTRGGAVVLAYVGTAPSAPPHTVFVSVSPDRGTTWTPWQIAVPADVGRIYAVWLDEDARGSIRLVWRQDSAAPVGCSALGIARSDDGGLTWHPLGQTQIPPSALHGSERAQGLGDAFQVGWVNREGRVGRAQRILWNGRWSSISQSSNDIAVSSIVMIPGRRVAASPLLVGGTYHWETQRQLQVYSGQSLSTQPPNPCEDMRR